MLIASPSCATSYFVEPAGLQPGRVRRRSVWRSEPGRAARPAAEALAPNGSVPAQWRENYPAAPARLPPGQAVTASLAVVHLLNRRDPIADLR